MLDLAQRRAGTLGADVEPCRATRRLPWPDASFDTVVLHVRAVLRRRRTNRAARGLRASMRPDEAVLLADHVESSSGVLRAGQSLLDAVERRHVFAVDRCCVCPRRASPRSGRRRRGTASSKTRRRTSRASRLGTDRRAHLMHFRP